MTDRQFIWQNLLNQLQEIFSKPLFDLYVSNAQPVSFQNNILTVEIQDDVQEKAWESYLLTPAKQIFNDLVPNSDIKLVKRQDMLIKNESPSFKPQRINLNASYSFDNFVVGAGNLMAHAAALAVSENPGTIYNPLFFYGGSGLGKTHLMHAIGNAILKNNPDAVIRYVTSEDFVNEFTTAIRTGSMEQFRNDYRQVDLLLVDDIQFLVGKDGTLDEFFHTFNALHNAGKQIVLTSDRYPSEIPKLPDRLVSRFGSGLTSDITPPDLETRTAILRKKANSLKIDISDDTLYYIAGQVNSNVRELESALNRVNFYAVTKQSDININLAAEALKNLGTNDVKKVASIYDIQLEVSKLFNVTIEQLRSKKRTKDIVIPRQVAMYLAREITQSSLPKIGNEFGGKDHTTVMHACEKIQQTLDAQSDIHLIQQINTLKSKF